MLVVACVAAVYASWCFISTEGFVPQYITMWVGQLRDEEFLFTGVAQLLLGEAEFENIGCPAIGTYCLTILHKVMHKSENLAQVPNVVLGL